MSVFSYRTFNQIESAAGGLFTLFFNKTAMILEPEEFITAFINPDHIDKLKEVQELVGLSTQTWARPIVACSKGDSFYMYLSFSGGAPVIVPQYIQNGLQPTCDPAVREKILGWLDERVRFGDMFGDVKDALNWLNETCNDAEAMTLLLPCLPTIMGQMSSDGDSKTTKRARKLTTIKSFGALPKLPVQVKQRLQEISAVVNSITLMLDVPEPEVKASQAVVTLSGYKIHKRTSLFAPGSRTASFV